MKSYSSKLRILFSLLAACMLPFLLSFVAGSAIDPSHAYVVDSDSYATLDGALHAVPSGGTIILQRTSSHSTANTVTTIAKDITFDLTKGDLTIRVSGGLALEVKNCTVALIGDGHLNVIGGVGIQANNATIMVDQVTGNQGNGAFAFNGGKITVRGDAKGQSEAVFAFGDGSTVTVEGNAISMGNDVNSIGAKAEQLGTVTVNGKAEGYGYGVHANNYATITVKGNVTAIGSDSSGSVGAYATDNSTVTIDGNLTGEIFAQVNGTRKDVSEKTFPTTKTGYDTYAESTSTVWVKIPAAIPIPLDTPSGLIWDDASPGTIKAKWDAVPNAEKYYVYLYMEGYPHSMVDVLTSKNEWDFHAYIVSTGMYTFRVKAVPAAGSTSYTNSELSVASSPYNYTAPVCEIGTVKYTTFAAALAAVKDFETITLLQNIIHKEAVAISKDITLDLGNYNLTIDTSGNPYGVANFTALTVSNFCTVNVVGNGELNVKGIARGIWAVDGGNVAVHNAETTNQNSSIVSAAAHAQRGGKITVLGNAKGYLVGAAATDMGSSSVTVKGDAMSTAAGGTAVLARSGSVTVEGNAAAMGEEASVQMQIVLARSPLMEALVGKAILR